MSAPWVYLLCRYGDDIGSPTVEQIRAAAHELFNENLPGMTEGDYEEHGAASLRYGFDEGPMYVLEVTRGGLGRWEEWADQDYNEELAPGREVSKITEDRAVELWVELAEGNIDAVRSAFTAAT